MNTIRRRGSHAEKPFYTESDIERIAVEELLSVDLLPSSPEPIRIERFVEKRFRLDQVCYEDLPARVLGYTQFGQKGVEAIFISRHLADDRSGVSERRISSTLAHEAGHGLLHGYLFMLDSFPMKLFEDDKDVSPAQILCRDGPTDRLKLPAYDGRWWEYQANRMIGALLLPKPLVIAAVAPLLSPNGELGVPTLADELRLRAASHLADVFDVNRAVAEIRLQGLYPRVSIDQLTL
jgi:hypothetical protein